MYEFESEEHRPDSSARKAMALLVGLKAAPEVAVYLIPGTILKCSDSIGDADSVIDGMRETLVKLRSDVLEMESIAEMLEKDGHSIDDDFARDIIIRNCRVGGTRATLVDNERIVE